MTQQTKQQFQYLLLQYLSGKATDRQEDLLFAMIDDEKETTEWQLILEEIMMAESEATSYNKEEWQPVVEKILNRKTIIRKIPVWKKIAIAASVLLVISLGSYFIFFNKQTPTPHTPQLTADVKAPETNRAMITLADGRTIYLDSAANGTLFTQNDISVIKTSDGKIIYSSTPSAAIAPTAVLYNTLTNPRGSKVINMTLSDGSVVWLNAGSSITYPVAFINNERKVSIDGEAYFEITHDKAKPFIVSANDKADVTVLGTHFNVNAYNDEEELKVTLLEGSVSVSSVKSSVTSVLKLKPGQQAVLTPDSRLQTLSPDLEAVMAWKTGFFEFDAAPAPVILRQLSRWYGVSIKYQSAQPNIKLGGRISRNLPLSNVLQLLRENGVNCKQENGTIIVE